MPELSILAGSVSQTLNLFMKDNSSTFGTGGLTNLLFNTASLTCNYAFPRGGSTSIALQSLASSTAAWTSGGFLPIDTVGMKGWYRFDAPNAMFAANQGREVALNFQGAARLIQFSTNIELTGCDNQDSIHFGLTAVPNAVAGAASGLHINGVNSGTTTYGALTVTGATTLTGGLAANITGNLTGNVIGSVTVGTGGADSVAFTTNARTFLQSGLATTTGLGSVSVGTGGADSAAFTANAITRIQSGLATTTGLGSVSVGTSGMDSTAFTANAITRMNSGLATSAQLGSVSVGTSGADSAAFTTNARTFLQSGLATTAGFGSVTVTTNSDKTGYTLTVTPPTTAQIATALWQDTSAGDFTVTSSIGKSLYTGVAPGGTDGLFIAGVNATTGIIGGLTAELYGNLHADVLGSVFGDILGNVRGDVRGSVTVGTNNDKTGYALAVTPPTAAQVATAVMASTVAGVSLTDAVRYVGAAVCGLSSGSGTGTETYKDFAGATAFVATIDANKDRTGMNYQ